MGLINRKAFTLLEVLIATTIFAVIMLIATGTVAQSSSYRSKLATLRQVNEETRRIADQITRDVRLANSTATVTDSASPAVTKKFKNGLALLNCNASTCTFKNSAAPSGAVTYGNPFLTSGLDSINANTLVIATKDNYKIYMLANDNKSIYYSGTIPITSTLTWAIINPLKISGNKISSDAAETAINFGGFCPDDLIAAIFAAISNQQPYVQFYITSRTAAIGGTSYDDLPPNMRAQAELRSMVTSRSYNN